MTETPRQLVIRFCFSAILICVSYYFHDFLRAHMGVHTFILGLSAFLFLGMCWVLRKVEGGFQFALACGVALALMFYTLFLTLRLTDNSTLSVIACFAVLFGMAWFGRRTGFLNKFGDGEKAAPGGGSHGDSENS